MTRAEIKKKFDEIVDFAEIERFLDTPVKRYSSGMYVRLAFAVAAHLEPEILLVDEVLAVGDAQFQKKCLGKMEDASAREGRTVLFVSHNMPTIQRICTKAICLNRGGILLQGLTSEVVGAYLEMSSVTSYAWQKMAVCDDKDAYIQAVRIVDEYAHPINYVCTGSILRVEFLFRIVKQINNIQLSVGLLDEFYNVIFGSSPLDAGVDNPTEPGDYRAVVSFPKDILLSKNYGIRTVLWTPEGGLVDAFEDIKFFAHETMSLANSTPCGRLGLVAIVCGWTINQEAKA
jgi:lipopolysaccharide transport system ATP-binding protein